MFKFLSIFSLLVGVSVAQKSLLTFKPVNELPANIPTCSQNDLNINKCMKAGFQSMVPRIREGIPELSIPPLDPFVLEKTQYQFSNELVQGRIAMRNVRVYGLSQTTIDSVDFKQENGRMRMKVVSHVPHITVEGNYKADMKLNDLKMTPKGYFNVSISDIVTTSRPEGEFYERDGHKYLRLTSIKAEPVVGDMKIYATGIFSDASLNDIVLDFVNQYWRQIYKAVLPESRTTWEPLMLNTANEFFAALPIDLLLTNK